MTSKPRLVACPTCKKMAEFSPTNAFRPFCSHRCKMIDLGEWAEENYKIPDNKPVDDYDDNFN